MLGRIPKDVPKVTWTVTETATGMVRRPSVVGKVLVGHVDNSAYPGISVDIQMTLVTPADAKGPVPVMMMFGGGRGIPGGTQPAGRGRPAGHEREALPPLRHQPEQRLRGAAPGRTRRWRAATARRRIRQRRSS